MAITVFTNVAPESKTHSVILLGRSLVHYGYCRRPLQINYLEGLVGEWRELCEQCALPASPAIWGEYLLVTLESIRVASFV